MGKPSFNPCGKGLLWRFANIWIGPRDGVATFEDAKIVYYDKVMMGVEFDGFLTYFPAAEAYVEVL